MLIHDAQGQQHNGETQPLLGKGADNNNSSSSDSDSSSQKRSVSTPWDVYTVSAAFLVLFLAFNSLQNYTTSLLPDGLGNISLAILYISVPVFCFAAPPIVKKLGEKWTMVLGSATYIVYMGSLVKVCN